MKKTDSKCIFNWHIFISKWAPDRYNLFNEPIFFHLDFISVYYRNYIRPKSHLWPIYIYIVASYYALKCLIFLVFFCLLLTFVNKLNSFLERISSRKRASTTVNKICLTSTSLKKSRVTSSTIIGNIINDTKSNKSVEEKLLFNKSSHQYQNKKETK